MHYVRLENCFLFIGYNSVDLCGQGLIQAGWRSTQLNSTNAFGGLILKLVSTNEYQILLLFNAGQGDSTNLELYTTQLRVS
jgi:hypothetical protein